MAKSFFIVAVDGPAAAGKSTVSRLAAARLGALHVDSGALYRGLTWQCLRAGADLREPESVLRVMRGMRLEFAPEGGSLGLRIDGRKPGEELRSETIGAQTSAVAALAPVRTWMVTRLRELAGFGSLVMEGRDIGTVVFPDTPFKFYLQADPDTRARRRRLDLAAGEGDTGRIRTALLQRDALDSGRAAAPLVKAADARVIDTTRLTAEEVAAQIVAAVRERSGA